MDKTKVFNTFLGIGSFLLMGVTTFINNKLADNKMKEAVREIVVEEVKKQLTN